MNVQLRYQNQNHDFQFENGATLASLMTAITSKFQIPAESQKIIFRGKSLTNVEPLVNGMKLLLMVSGTPPVLNSNTQVATPRKFSSFVPTVIDTLRESNHKEILALGLPEGYIKPSKYSTSVLPSVPFYVRETSGKRSILSIETDALFLQNDDGTVERIFFTEIIKSAQIVIPDTNGEFIAIGLITKQGNRWIYWIPNQYCNLFKVILHQ